MTSDVRAQQAREHHLESQKCDAAAERHRRSRNDLVRALRADDPARWTYSALAATLGCSQELIAAIVQGRVGRA